MEPGGWPTPRLPSLKNFLFCLMYGSFMLSNFSSIDFFFMWGQNFTTNQVTGWCLDQRLLVYQMRWGYFFSSFLPTIFLLTLYLHLQAHDYIMTSGGERVKIPMEEDHVRCLNLSVSVGIGLYEALRQLDYPLSGSISNL